MMVVTANAIDVNITDADGLPVTNGSTIPVNSSLVCSTPYDRTYNFTFSWSNLYRSEVVAGNTLMLRVRDIGSFSYRCTVENVVTYGTQTKRCNTSRSVHGNVAHFGINLV